MMTSFASSCIKLSAIMAILLNSSPQIEARLTSRKLGSNEFFANVGVELFGSQSFNVEGALFGATLSLSVDGTILAVGSPKHDYITPQADARLVADDAGAITIFKLSDGGVWKRVWFITGNPGESIGKYFSLSDDGSRIAIRRSRNGQAPVEVYSIEPSSTDKKRIGADLNVPCYDGYKGKKMTLSGDGNRIAVSCENFNLSSPGEVTVFEWDGSKWFPVGGKLTGALSGDSFGWATSLSFDGNRLAISGPNHDTYTAFNCGIVQIFSYDQGSNQWKQEGRDLVGTVSGEQFGFALDMSPDGLHVAVGSPGASSGGLFFSGSVQVFRKGQNDNWVVNGKLINGTSSAERFGTSVAISNNGLRVAGGSSDITGSATLRLFTLESDNVWKQYGTDVPGDGVAINNDATMIACASSKYNDVGKVQVVEATGLEAMSDPPVPTVAPSTAFEMKIGIGSAEATGICHFSFDNSADESSGNGEGRRRLKATLIGNRLLLSPGEGQDDFEIYLDYETETPRNNKRCSAAVSAGLGMSFLSFVLTTFFMFK